MAPNNFKSQRMTSNECSHTSENSKESPHPFFWFGNKRNRLQRKKIFTTATFTTGSTLGKEIVVML